MKKIIIISALTLVLACNSNRPDYSMIATFQDNTIPDIEVDADSLTRVLLILPHADDETIAGGLIALLKDRGAYISLLTLCAHNEERIQELRCSTAKLGIDDFETGGFINNTWDDIMRDEITFWYDQKDSIRSVIRNKIDSFAPDILITYDSEIGGYGHPEHRISAELTEEIFIENMHKPEFRPETIFQITLSKDLEAFLVAETPGYELSRKLTGSTGLPDPDVAVDIRKYWKIKNEAAKCHRSQQDILEKFYIIYNDRDEGDHVNAFSKEYYKLITK